MTTDNVYKRLQTARVAVQAMPLKESGNNTFAKYTYMELGDFMPQINTACLNAGICGVVNFTDVATLTIVNTDAPDDRIVFSSPLATADLKGCHPIQNFGAVQTYLRRYLWMMAFDIVEHDALDTTHGRDPLQKTVVPPKTVNDEYINDAQRKMIFAKMKAANIEPTLLKDSFQLESTSKIKRTDLNNVLAWIDLNK